MFLLLRYAFKKAVDRTKDRNICILGIDSAGKSTLLNDIRYVFHEPTYSQERLMPTIGLNFSKIQVGNYQCTFWDLGGQTKLRNAWEEYFTDVDVVVWVVDSADTKRYEESAAEFAKVISDSKLIHVPVCIVANKQDLANPPLTKSEAIKLFKLTELEDHPYAVFQTSLADTDVNKHTGFNNIVDWIIDTLKVDPASKRRTEWRKSVLSQQIV